MDNTIQLAPNIIITNNLDDIQIASNNNDIIMVCDDRDISYNKDHENFNFNATVYSSIIGAPKIVKGDFYCSCNDHLKSLKGSPKYVYGNVNLSDNPSLEDISDLPINVGYVNIENDYNLKVFTKEIDSEDNTLTFHNPPEEVKSRIKSWPYYGVVDENQFSITVVIKSATDEYFDSI